MLKYTFRAQIRTKFNMKYNLECLKKMLKAEPVMMVKGEGIVAEQGIFLKLK